MKLDNLLDRDNEIKDLSSIINSQNSTNTIILLLGISGVGKSGLIEKFKYSGFISNDVITVKTSKNSVETIENYQYFNNIYLAFENFSFKHPTLVPTPTEHGVKSLGNIINYAFFMLRSRLGFGDAEPLAEQGEKSSIIRKKDYILYVLNNSNIILNIDNIQNIDTQSFELLKFIIQNSRKKTYIFEYTLGEKNKEHLLNLIKELKDTEAHLIKYKVEKIDFNIAKALIPNNNQINIEKVRKQYNNSQGNLMEIILANENSDFNASNIDISIRKLSIYEKYIIYIIYLNDSCIKKELLYLLCYQNTNNNTLSIYYKRNNIDELISLLVQKKIIISSENTISLIHDSIKNELDKITYDPILFCAYASLKDYYFSVIRESKDLSEIELLVFLCIKFSDEELFSVIPILKSLLFEQKYPKLLIEKLEKYRESIQKIAANNSVIQKGIYDLSMMLIEVCITHKLYEEAQNNLNLIFDINNSFHIALQGIIFSLKEDSITEKELRSLVDNAPQNTRLKLILDLSLMNYCMKIQAANISEKIGSTIINNSYYKHFKEYAYALRNYAELCNDNETAIDYYNKALEIFEANKMILNISSVHISLAMIYSYKGELLKAKSALKKAVSLDKSSTTICYVLNNIAAIDILGNKHSKKTEKALLDSSLLSVSIYETILIYCNLLVYYCLTEEYINASFYAKKIEEKYNGFKYEEFLHIVYQDLFYYYTKIHESKKAKNYYGKILKLIEDKDTKESTKQLAKAINGLSTNNIFYSKFPFRVDFLGYWEFMLDSSLDHYL